MSLSFPRLLGVPCEASVEIRAGHVMCCVTLANARREENSRCIFLCREHVWYLIEIIRQSGRQVLTLQIRGIERMGCGLAPKHLFDIIGNTVIMDVAASTTVKADQVAE